MIVTSPFDYGSVLQRAAQIKRTNALTNITNQQSANLQAQTERQNALITALGSGDMESAMQADPIRAQQFQTNEEMNRARRLANLRASAPQVIPALDRVINSKNPAQMAQLVGEELEELGIGGGQIRSFLAGAPTNESIIEKATAFRDHYASTIQASSQDGLPSSVREWNFFNSLPPEDQERFLNMKRAQQVISQPGVGTGVLRGGRLDPIVTEAETQAAHPHR